MTTLPWWKRAIMAIGASIATIAALAGQPRPGHSAEPPQAPDIESFKYAGSASCKSCHEKPERNNFPKAAGFIKINEYATWETEDKHSLAYDKLTKARGQRMASLLKVNVLEREGGCLGCHSASTSEVANRKDQGVQFNPSEGVSCENCHGPSEVWLGPHLDPKFRAPKADEWAKSGFTDLRSPEKQAHKCLSCHIGDVAEGKLVTHQMYAAGHPPLPSIEVATFTNSIPRHWWLIAERKNADVRKQLGHKEGELEQTRLGIVGAAVALRTSLKLLADEARGTGTAGVPGQKWPDYARYDCWSCHHDLKRNGWRQDRGFAGPPGRPPIALWPLPLVDLGIDRLAIDDPQGAAALRASLKRFQGALLDHASARPFGRKSGIIQAADDFAGWSDSLIHKLSAASYDQTATLILLRTLVAKSGQADIQYDYDAARHIGWTIQLLVADLGDKLPRRAEIKDVLARMDKGMNLHLPAGREVEIEDQLGAALQTIGDYEPAQFRKHLQELAGLL